MKIELLNEHSAREFLKCQPTFFKISKLCVTVEAFEFLKSDMHAFININKLVIKYKIYK